MKFSTTINHAGVASIGMIGKTDLVDWCLLDYIANFEACEKAKKIGEKVWINFKHLISEMPMLGLNSKSSVSNRIEKLRVLGLLDKHQDLTDQKLYVQTSELYKTASNFCAYTVLQTKPPVQTEKQPVHESEHKTVNQDYLINNLNQNPSSFSQAVISLSAEQQEVFDWAVTHPHWCTATVSLETFIHVHDFPNGKLKAQYDAHKKARTPSTVNGLKSENITKKSEVNNATPLQQNQPKRILDDEKIRRIFDKNASAIKKDLDKFGFVVIDDEKVEKSRFEACGLIGKAEAVISALKPSQLVDFSEPENDYPEMRRNKMNEFFGNTSINELTNKLLVNTTR